MLDSQQQFQTLLERSRSAMILLPQNPSSDAIGAGWGLYFFLQKRGMEAAISFAHDPAMLGKYSFLPRPETIGQSVAGARDFVLSFNTKYNKILDLRSEALDNELRIYITPEKGSIDPRDFSFIPAKFKYDIVIVLGCADKESLGKLYEENPDIFYEVPIINIDNHIGNEQYGQVNIVDMVASSTSEMLVEILESVDAASINEKAAQCLLMGIIDATNSFQQKNTTPRALNAAANLMTKGANQQEIVRYLYKTQPLHLLKLWGRVMSRLIWEEDMKLAWAPVMLEDFVQSRSSAKDIPEILEKIRDNYAAARAVMMLFQDTPEQVKGIIKFSDEKFYSSATKILEANEDGDSLIFTKAGNNVQAVGEQIAKSLQSIM